ncbi:MAG: hypothetical protein QXD61_11385 [Candidatus Caldarchaeum sp.]
MSAEEFFQVLADSQLYRAFPWYYQGIGPFVVFLIALFCSMYLIWRSWTSTSDKLSDTSLKGRWQEHKKSSTPTKDFLTDAYVHLGIARIVVTLVALLVASSSFGLRSHPLWLLRLLNPQIDSLYDLTPNGVQFVVDYLMAVTILSVFTAFCLFVMTTGTYWLEKREITPVDELIELMRRGRANKKKPLSPGVVFMGIGLILLVGIVTNLNTKYQDVTTRQEVDSRVICDGQKSVETVERIWEEVKDVKSRWKHTLAVRFSDAKVPPELVTVQMGSQRETVLIEGEASAHFDPLSVVVVPLIEGELSNSEQKFAAEVLRVLLAGFALRGVENYDKAWLYLPSVSSSNLSYQKKDFLWANAAANELYLWLRFTRTELDKATLVGFLVRVASDLPTPNIGEGQSDAKPVLILYRWFPRHQPEYLNIASVYNQLWNDNFQLWIVDLTSSRYRDHVFEIGLRPEIFVSANNRWVKPGRPGAGVGPGASSVPSRRSA